MQQFIEKHKINKVEMRQARWAPDVFKCQILNKRHALRFSFKTENFQLEKMFISR